MSKHLNKSGYFKSTKHPELKENKIMLDFRDTYAQEPLIQYAKATHDKELAEDIQAAVERVRKDGLTKKPD